MRGGMLAVVYTFFCTMLVSLLWRPLWHFVPLPLEGAALRGKGLGLARWFAPHPLGAPLRKIANMKKKRQYKDQHCHSETSSQTGRGNPFLLVAAVCFMRGVRECGLPRRFAPRNDRLFIPCSIIHRLPLWKRESRVKTTTAIPLKWLSKKMPHYFPQ